MYADPLGRLSLEVMLRHWPEFGVALTQASVDDVNEQAQIRRRQADQLRSGSPVVAVVDAEIRTTDSPASGYYEWQAQPTGPKQPHYIHPPDGGLLAMAGLYEWWQDRQLPADHPDRWLLSTTILTTVPTPQLAPIHNRMPAFLGREDIDTWLDRQNNDTNTLTDLIRASTANIGEHLAMRPVSRDVGRVSINHAGLIHEVVA